MLDILLGNFYFQKRCTLPIRTYLSSELDQKYLIYKHDLKIYLEPMHERSIKVGPFSLELRMDLYTIEHTNKYNTI